MKIYKVKVNGKLYEVELEAISESNEKIEDAKEEPKENTSSLKEIVAPIAGKVVSVKVSVGDHISKGQVVLVIEAMKLENEVVSPFEGQVAEILVTKGQNVKANDIIVTIE